MKELKHLVIGINVYSYLINYLKGYKVIGKPGRVSKAVFRAPIQDLVQIQGLLKDNRILSIYWTRSAVYFQGSYTENFRDFEQFWWRKVGVSLPMDLRLGENAYLNVDMRSHQNWYTVDSIKSITPMDEGGFRVETQNEVYLVQELISVLPLRVLARLMKRPFSGNWVSVYRIRYKEELPVSREVSYVYDIDPDNPAHRYVFVHDISTGERYWSLENWTTDKKKVSSDYYSIPIPTPAGKIRNYEGVVCWGPYATWYPGQELEELLMTYA